MCITNCETSTGKDVPEQLVKCFQKKITELRSTVQCVAWVRKTTQVNINVSRTPKISLQEDNESSFTLR